MKFLREGEVLNSDFNKWFLVSNNLISERSINYDQSVSFIPEIKTPQNKFIGTLFEENLQNRRARYEKKRHSEVGAKETKMYQSKEIKRHSD